jgi:DNA-binding NarL/FixJ family response regulator
MKLEYKILWFEDNESWYNSIYPLIEDFLHENGFELNPRRESGGDNIDCFINNEEFDLIIMDFNLAGAKGDKLIESLRQHQIYTEIVFYSQNGAQAVRDAVISKGVDGVFCASRDTEEFEEKVTKVIYNTIKKVQDVNNLRGLVIAETSELDEKMIDIIALFCSVSESHKVELLKKTIENREDRLKDLKKVTPSIMERDKLCSMLESFDRLRAVLRLISNIETKPFTANVALLTTCYKKEIIDIRNILAHVKEETDKNGKKILKSKMIGHETFEFNDQKCIEIRKDIQKHAENLDYILQNVHKHVVKEENGIRIILRICFLF